MDKYGLIGNPLKHSLSPFIHGCIYEGLGIDAEYSLYPIEEDLGGNLLRLHDEGIKGINVTVPYKEAVIPFLYDIDPVALYMGAVNTLTYTKDGYIGQNTDIIGLSEEFQDIGVSLEGKDILIIGAGGAARAAAFMAIGKDPGSVTIINRNRKKAEKIRNDMKKYLGESRDTKDIPITVLGLEDTDKLDKSGYIAIQCTSVGLSPDYDSVIIKDPDLYKKLSVGLDVIYSPKTTLFMQLCRANGVPAYNGLKMLLYQAVAAFKIWTGRDVPKDLTDSIYNRLYSMQTRNVVLIGFMGSGKTSVGKELAKALDYDFVDTDSLIEAEEGRSISRIFEENGEEYFRDLEEALAKRLSLETDRERHMVLSVGGGLVLRENNRKYLKKTGLVIYLKASADTIRERLKADKNRPLLAKDKDKRIDELLSKREAVYEMAGDIVIDTDDMSVEEVVLKGERRV